MLGVLTRIATAEVYFDKVKIMLFEEEVSVLLVVTVKANIPPQFVLILIMPASVSSGIGINARFQP